LIKKIYFDLDGVSENVARIEVIRYQHGSFKWKTRRNLREADTDGGVTLKFIKQMRVEVWTGFN
jgi:hypothetical protein